jgi:hypothetical protein
METEALREKRGQTATFNKVIGNKEGQGGEAAV